MEWLFGKRKTPQEMLKENQRALNKSMRELNRESNRMEMQEKKTIADIKKAARMGQMDTVRALAKDLIRTRQYQKKFIMMRTNIQAVSLKVQGLKNQDAMSQAMKGVTHVMTSMNRQLNFPEMRQIMSDFERQGEIMDMKGEMIDGVIHDTLGDKGEEEQTETIVQQVLDELGIQMGEQLGNLPTAEGALDNKVAMDAKQPQAVAISTVDTDLQARLDKLRC